MAAYTNTDNTGEISCLEELDADTVDGRHDTNNWIPSLPAGKSHHAMFSFSSEDREWVRAVLEKLEAPPYRLQCCFSDRDFHPGMDVLTNIETLMAQSLNIIMVISPEHLSSQYCDFEMSLAMDQAHQKLGKVIPVLRRGEEVPSGLRFINYIDARDGTNEDEVMHKLYKAVIEGLQQKRAAHILLDPCVRNGEEVRCRFERAPPGKKTCWNWAASYVGEPTEEMLDECERLGMKLSAQTLRYLARLCNTSAYIRAHWLFNTHRGRAVLFFMITLFIYFTVCILLSMYKPDNIEVIVSVCNLVHAGAFIWMPLLIVTWIYKEKESYIALCGQISRSTYKKKFVVCLGDEKHSPVVRIIKYDIVNCQEYIRENFLCRPDREMTDKEKTKLTQTIVDSAMLRYPEVFLDSDFVAAQIRHPVRRDVLCLCQYVERRAIHQDVLNNNIKEASLWQVLRRWWIKRCNPDDGDRVQLVGRHDDAISV